MFKDIEHNRRDLGVVDIIRIHCIMYEIVSI